MNLLEKIIAALSATMKEPTPYGWFHLMMFSIMIAIAVIIAIAFRNSTDKQNRIILLVFACISLSLELYKQLVFSYDATNDSWTYHWCYTFPFQFCSTPMYVAFIASLLKKGKVQDSLLSFLAVYGMPAGLLVMITVGDIFVDLIGINIQTMVHHGTQVVFGVYLFTSGRVKINWKTPLKALPVFVTLVAIALTLDIVIYKGLGIDNFNMFFISPYFEPPIILFPLIYNNFPYPIFLLAYIFGFTLLAYITTLIAFGIKMLIKVLNNTFSKAYKENKQKA